MGQTPLIGMIKQIIQQKLAAPHRALNAVPAPFQMRDSGQSSTRQAAFMLPQTSSHHHHQDNANAIGPAQWQGLNQAIIMAAAIRYTGLTVAAEGIGVNFRITPLASPM